MLSVVPYPCPYGPESWRGHHASRQQDMWKIIEDGLCQAELLSHLLECIGLFFAGALCEQGHEFLILAY